MVPAQLLFRYTVRTRTKLPHYSPDQLSDPDDITMRDADAEHKQRPADYADQLRHAEDRSIAPGDTVLLRNASPSTKLTPTYLPDRYEVTSRRGDQLTLRSPDNVEVKRNVQFAKPTCSEPTSDSKKREEPSTETSTARPPEATAAERPETREVAQRSAAAS